MLLKKSIYLRNKKTKIDKISPITPSIQMTLLVFDRCTLELYIILLNIYSLHSMKFKSINLPVRLHSLSTTAALNRTSQPLHSLKTRQSTLIRARPPLLSALSLSSSVSLFLLTTSLRCTFESAWVLLLGSTPSLLFLFLFLFFCFLGFLSSQKVGHRAIFRVQPAYSFLNQLTHRRPEIWKLKQEIRPTVSPFSYSSSLQKSVYSLIKNYPTCQSLNEVNIA